MGQTLLTLGLQREKAGRASLAIYTSVFFAIILELVIFHTFPSLLSLVGVSIILTSALYVAVSPSPFGPVPYFVGGCDAIYTDEFLDTWD